jgi:alpha-amylase
MKPPSLLLTLCLVLGFGAKPASADVILHAFEWRYPTVERNAAAIAAAGYKAVLVAPPLKSSRAMGCPWYVRYQPQDFRVIDNCAGNKQQFVSMIDALRREGVRVYADVVVNHMANERNNATTFPGTETLQAYRAQPAYWNAQKLYGRLGEGLFQPQDFHAAACILDYNNPTSIVQDRLCDTSPGRQPPDRGLPDLRDTVPGENWVLDQRRAYVQSLFDLGVRGFRLDAAKHMPNGAIRYFIPDSIADRSHVFAETIVGGGSNDGEYQRYLQPYLAQLPASFGAYDFPLFHALRNSLAPGGRLSDLADPYATGNALEARRAVTFTITHDIPYNGIFRGLILEPTDERLAYAYILGRDGGTPLVFDDGSAEKADGGRWVGSWKQPWLTPMIAFHNRLQGQPMQVLHADDCTLLWRRGRGEAAEGIVAINKCGFEAAITVDTDRRFFWNRTYRDSLDPTSTERISGNRHTFHLPARTARLWSVEGPI